MELQKIYVALALKAEEYREGLDRAAGLAKAFRDKAGSAFSDTFNKIKMGVIGIATSFVSNFRSIIDQSNAVNSQLETTRLQFETLMGSAQKAEEHVAGLFEFAEKTPFETGPIIDASLKLQTFGGEALNTMENLKLIGDAAAATNSPINDLGFWVGRLYANLQAGQPFGEAASRLQELAVISPQARTEMEKLQKAGASAQEIFGYFQQDLGKFTGAMEKQASTWSGMMSTIKDQVQLMLAETLLPVFENSKNGLASIIDMLNDPAFLNGVEEFAKGIAKIAGGLAKLFEGVAADIAATGLQARNEAKLAILQLSFMEERELRTAARQQVGAGLFVGARESLEVQKALQQLIDTRYAHALAMYAEQETALATGEALRREHEQVTQWREAQQRAYGVLAQLLPGQIGHVLNLKEADLELFGVQMMLNDAMAGNAPVVEEVTQNFQGLAVDTGIWNENAAIAYHQATQFAIALGYDAEALAEQKLAAEAAAAVTAHFGDVFRDVLDDYTTRLPKANEALIGFGDTHTGLVVNVDAAKQAVLDQLIAIEAAPEIIAAYGLAIGVMTEEQAEAALEAAALKVKIEELGIAIAGGMPVEAALADLDAFIYKIENGMTPAAEKMAKDVPQHVMDMKERVGEEALAAGQGLGTGFQQGIDETSADAIGAAVKVAEDVITDTKDTYGIQSPSTVFHGIGADLMQGLKDGIESLVTEVVGRVKGIGNEVIDGIIAGIEEGKERLRTILSGLADLIPDWLAEFLGIASPATAMIPIGEAIVEGIIEGIGDTAGDLYQFIDRVIQQATTAGGLVADFGTVFARTMIAPIDQEIQALEEGLKDIVTQRKGLLPVLRNVLAGFGLDLNDPAAELQLRKIRDAAVWGSDIWARAELGLNLMTERSRLTEEELALQVKLAEAEEKRAALQERMLEIQEKQQQLQFLQMQFDLLQMMKENELDFSILEGIRLGTEASPIALMEIMGIVMDQLVQKASDELFSITATGTPVENTTTPGIEEDRAITNINTQNIHGGQHIYINEQKEDELEALMEYLK